ncbi:ribosome-binding protein 1 isoform X3 [Anoplophora glabripennis]|uniref:ribosome-binding protein 1 isoform X3 n=1 Tax=Anoplophora glabripennis TaxID=217634 RepID=UPI0008753CAB|nr:ribosome-binding protein 1 isoform X3 [Anoplophora glabripennis]
MDVSTPLIFIALFLLAFCSLFLVYKFGIKEKSYEEALAEQRQTTNALLGVKPKPKEKKNKKAAKKLKEKTNPPGNETDESENIENPNVDNSPPNKPHVEFKEEPEEVPIKEVVQIKPKRVKKVRPILVKRDKSPEKVILDVVDTPIVNHFEENPPKDDFELLRSNSRDDIFKQEAVKEKIVKEKKQNLEVSPPMRNNKKSTKQQAATNSTVTEAPPVVEKEADDKVVEPATVVPQTNGIVGNLGKEKKKKKSEFNTRQQLSAERDGLIKLVRKAEFSKSEIQLLIDLLLNKQLEAPEVIDDWSEGKSDPVQKLKKQLAEKEKSLAEEQEALLGVQAKLKEIRSEQQAEKSQLQQKIRGLEEVVQNKQIEQQATNNRLQVNTQKIQQLQADLNAEILKTHKLVEDNAALQMQIQQFEVRISQVQDTDNIVATLKNDVEELSAQNQHLRLELQQNVAEKDHQQQQFMIQMGNLEKGLKQQIQQLEESRQDLERNLEMAVRQENDWKMEISNINTALQQQYEEKRRLEQIIDQVKDELQVVNNEKAENIKIIAQLKLEIQQLQEDQVSQVNGSSEESKAQEVEILNLTNELSSVKNELSTVRFELQQSETRYKTELESSNKKYSTIQVELEEQKKKNNELRTKNWKVMEALNVAESRSKANSANKQTDLNLDKIKNEIRVKEQDSQKEFIQRLFPEIEDLQVATAEDWQAEFGKLIRNYVSDLKKQQTRPRSPENSQNTAKLQAQLQHYKDIIDDTAGTLNRLQSHIQKEEINWRRQLQAKDTEIENLKESCVLPLKTKILSLEKQLSDEIKLKEQVNQECRVLKSGQPLQTDATATIEKLSEEVNHLREQLRVEQTKNGDVNVCLKAQNNNYNNSNPTNGPALIEGKGDQV